MRKEKIRETDFDVTRELPRNRISQFFDLAKHRFLDLFKLTLLLDLFILPVFVCYLFFSILLQGNPIEYAYTIYLYMCLAFIPCVIIFYVGLGGIAEPLKQLIWQEGYLGPANFFKGLKRNIKASLVAGLVESISIFLLMFGVIFLMMNAPSSDKNWILGVGIGLLIAQAVIVTITTFYVVMESTIYDLSIYGLFKNAFIFTFARLPINLLFLILFPGISVALFLIPVAFLPYIAIGINILFISIGTLIWGLNSISIFDIYINKEQHPDYYRKGLLIIEETKED